MNVNKDGSEDNKSDGVRHHKIMKSNNKHTLAALLFVGMLAFTLALAPVLGATTTIVRQQMAFAQSVEEGADELTAEELDIQNQMIALQDTALATLAQVNDFDNGDYRSEWSQVVWIEAGDTVAIFVDCLPGMIPQGGQELFSSSDLQLVQSLAVGVDQDVGSWLGIVENEDTEDRHAASIGVICEGIHDTSKTIVKGGGDNVIRTDVNIENNIITYISNVINIHNNVTVVVPNNNNNTNNGGTGNGTDTTNGVNGTDTGGTPIGEVVNNDTASNTQAARVLTTPSEEPDDITPPDNCIVNPDGTGCAIPPSGGPGTFTPDTVPQSPQVTVPQDDDDDTTTTTDDTTTDDSTTTTNTAAAAPEEEEEEDINEDPNDGQTASTSP